jgi:hypothetical protein
MIQVGFIQFRKLKVLNEKRKSKRMTVSVQEQWVKANYDFLLFNNLARLINPKVKNSL